MIITHTSKVRSIRWHTDDIFEVAIDRLDLPFSPGMAISVLGPDGKTVRSFSLSSGTAEPEFRSLIRLVPGGKVSPWIAEHKPGEEIQFRGPFGMFKPGQHKTPDPWIYICTGTGVTPLLSAFHSRIENPPVQVLYGVKRIEDAVYHRELAEWCDVRMAISREPRPEFHPGRVTDLLEAMPRTPDTYYYLCGLDAMMYDVIDWLHDHCVDKEHIKTEVFFKAPRKKPGEAEAEMA